MPINKELEAENLAYIAGNIKELSNQIVSGQQPGFNSITEFDSLMDFEDYYSHDALFSVIGALGLNSGNENPYDPPSLELQSKVDPLLKDTGLTLSNLHDMSIVINKYMACQAWNTMAARPVTPPEYDDSYSMLHRRLDALKMAAGSDETLQLLNTSAQIFSQVDRAYAFNRIRDILAENQMPVLRGVQLFEQEIAKVGLTDEVRERFSHKFDISENSISAEIEEVMAWSSLRQEEVYQALSAADSHNQLDPNSLN